LGRGREGKGERRQTAETKGSIKEKRNIIGNTRTFAASGRRESIDFRQGREKKKKQRERRHQSTKGKRGSASTCRATEVTLFTHNKL